METRIKTLCPTCKQEKMIFCGETTGSDALWCPNCGTITGNTENSFIIPKQTQILLDTNQLK